MLVKAIHELAAIRRVVEDAAREILTSAETLLEAVEKGKATRGQQEALVAIVTACGFHDLVGQRVTKITDTLEELKARMFAGSAEPSRRDPREAKRKQRRSRLLMLNGPALPESGNDQHQIDLIFAEA